MAEDEAKQPREPDRWAPLIEALNPERNLRAVADLMAQAASGSERVLESIAGSPAKPTADGDESEAGETLPLREVYAEFERSLTRIYDAAGRFMVERPLRSATGGAPARSAAEVAVLDGIGTTVVEIPGATGSPHCGTLIRHDGTAIGREAVTIFRTTSFDGDDPTFVVRVDVPPSTEPGTYHGQILVEGLPEVALALIVTVVDSTP